MHWFWIHEPIVCALGQHTAKQHKKTRYKKRKEQFTRTLLIHCGISSIVCKEKMQNIQLTQWQRQRMRKLRVPFYLFVFCIDFICSIWLECKNICSSVTAYRAAKRDLWTYERIFVSLEHASIYTIRLNTTKIILIAHKLTVELWGKYFFLFEKKTSKIYIANFFVTIFHEWTVRTRFASTINTTNVRKFSFCWTQKEKKQNVTTNSLQLDERCIHCALSSLHLYTHKSQSASEREGENELTIHIIATNFSMYDTGSRPKREWKIDNRIVVNTVQNNWTRIIQIFLPEPTNIT